jgi:retron-type reverse transcriptase
MSEQPRTRQELYDRIRQTSKDEFILDEMIRLGFWPRQGEVPQDPADEIRRRTELQKELNDLYAENRRLNNEEQLRKEARKQRLEASRQKQKENKERREQERIERAQVWQQRKQHELLYLGKGVSGGLNATACDAERLALYDLPAYRTTEEIAKAMGIALGALRFLAFARRTATVSHYVRFTIPKKTGGERTISAPMPRLKEAQYWVMHNILAKVQMHEAAHGFRPGRSIVSNAQPHVGSDVVINLDLQNFFPTITYRRVKGLFKALGYSEAAATVFALLCTEPEVTALELDRKRYFVAQSERYLPQGAPTSPVITNLLCRKLDQSLTTMATKLGFRYTRYADDLTFSASGESTQQVNTLLRRVAFLVHQEGFIIHPDKTRILRKGRQQEVTGIVVNDRLGIDRKELKRFRATLYQIERDGLENKHWGYAQDLLASLSGFANFVCMVDPAKGAAFQEQVRRIRNRHAY